MLNRVSVVLLTAFLVVAAPSAVFGAAGKRNAGKQHHTRLGPGCAPDRPAVAHHANAVVVKKARGTAPIPCVVATGYRDGEISLVVTKRGSLLFQPALKTEATGLPIGLLRSTNQGATWNFIAPGGDTATRVSGLDMNMWVDPDTGRVFWSNPGTSTPDTHGVFRPTKSARSAADSPGMEVDYSDNDGQTWTASGRIAMANDHAQLFSGPAPHSTTLSKPQYPDVIYMYVAGGGTCGSQGFCGGHIVKSLDGGRTWSSPVALPYPAGCPSPGSNPVGMYGLDGLVGPDGTIYLPLTPCQVPYVAISHDEGTTWTLSKVRATQTLGWGELGLGMDKAGNLYAAWVAVSNRLPYLSMSVDHGRRWSTPLMIAAPGVNEAAEPELVSGATGQVAVTYYGSTNSPGVPFPPVCVVSASGTPPSVYSFESNSVSCPAYEKETASTYITETFDALDRNPLFWSATLNKSSEPTWYGLTASGLAVPGQPFAIGSDALTAFSGPNGGGHTDYYSMVMAKDGTPWVGFFQECPRPTRSW